MDSNSDAFEIEGPVAYKAAIETLNKSNRAPSVLRLIMNALESYRQKRKLGWSRPWNKYGVRTFRSYRLDFTQDLSLIDLAHAVLATQSADFPPEAQTFINDLLSDDAESRQKLMGFIFYHEIEDETGVYEGMTFSFGRKNAKRYRDRLDMVFEAPVKDSHVGNLSRLRIFIDPFEAVGPPLWQCTVNADNEVIQQAFDQLNALYGAWADIPERAWDHWTSTYIDYFGPRRHFAQNTNFPIDGPEAKILMADVGT